MGVQSSTGTVGSVESGKRLDGWNNAMWYEGKEWLSHEEVVARIDALCVRLGITRVVLAEIEKQVVVPFGQRKIGEKWWQVAKLTKFDDNTYVMECGGE